MFASPFIALAYIGTAVFAFSGSLLGLNKRMDFVGVAFVATVTGIGGGTIRDLLIGRTPVMWMSNPTDIIICVVVSILVCVFYKLFMGRTMKWLLYADAIGMALFSVLGTAIADQTGAHPLTAILFGAISATFGGIVRDLICGEKPILFSHEVYVSASLLGGLIYIVLPETFGLEIRLIAGLSVAAIIRVLAIWRGWSIQFPSYAGNIRAKPKDTEEDPS